MTSNSYYDKIEEFYILSAKLYDDLLIAWQIFLSELWEIWSNPSLPIKNEMYGRYLLK